MIPWPSDGTAFTMASYLARTPFGYLGSEGGRSNGSPWHGTSWNNAERQNVMESGDLFLVGMRWNDILHLWVACGWGWNVVSCA